MKVFYSIKRKESPAYLLFIRYLGLNFLKSSNNKMFIFQNTYIYMTEWSILMKFPTLQSVGD